jgi:hypothetical protein
VLSDSFNSGFFLQKGNLKQNRFSYWTYLKDNIIIIIMIRNLGKSLMHELLRKEGERSYSIVNIRTMEKLEEVEKIGEESCIYI